ncbi:MAG: MAPEG family protein, partial [Zhongshania sp.]|nr:MAPEG family protein [Zhongshania sp.]
TLHKYIRAHANTIEFAPVLMVLMYILSQSQMAGWVLWSIILATVSRFVLVAGLIFPRTMARPNPLRQLGAAGTYIFGLALCIAVLNLALL